MRPDPAAGPGRDDLAHELRGSLSTIATWVAVLQRHLQNAPPTAQRALEGIRDAVAQQASLIERRLERPPNSPRPASVTGQRNPHE